eukprot:1142933-Pelagomonas_calceolata.AAC.2
MCVCYMLVPLAHCGTRTSMPTTHTHIMPHIMHMQASDSKNALGRQPSAGRRAANPAATQQQPQVAASGKPAAARPSAVQRVLDRQNSFDSVSELEV